MNKLKPEITSDINFRKIRGDSDEDIIEHYFLTSDQLKAALNDPYAYPIPMPETIIPITEEQKDAEDSIALFLSGYESDRHDHAVREARLTAGVLGAGTKTAFDPDSGFVDHTAQD